MAKKAENLGIRNQRLSPCPAKPNCVCSDDETAGHHIAPYKLAVEPSDAWRALENVVASLPRTRIIEATDDYLRAECTIFLFRFVDDLEFHLRMAERYIAVRSASRVGYSDLGVNRRRVEKIRKRLSDEGVILID